MVRFLFGFFYEGEIVQIIYMFFVFLFLFLGESGELSAKLTSLDDSRDAPVLKGIVQHLSQN